MKELTKTDIYLNRVETIEQFNVLKYLKENLDINEFEVFLCDRYTIKVIDKVNEEGYFKFIKDTKEIEFIEHIENDINF